MYVLYLTIYKYFKKVNDLNTYRDICSWEGQTYIQLKYYD